MATVNFFFRSKKTDKQSTINYDIHISASHRLRGSTKLKLIPKYWDEEKQLVRNVTAVSNSKDNINNKISEFKAFVFDKINDYKTYSNNKILLLLKDDIDIFFGKKVVDEIKEVTFYSFVDKYIEQSKNRIIQSTGRKISNRTILDYKRTLELLKEFEKKYKYEITFNSITIDFYYLFVEYLESHDFSINTVGKFIKQIKVFMRAATDEGINTNYGFKNKRFVKTTADSTEIYLNEKELDKIINLDLEDEPKLKKARDLFIVGAFTGLRVSDFNGLTEKNIEEYKGTNCIKVRVRKTNKMLTIPIHPEVQKIINNNNNNFPKSMPDQHINVALKIIGFEAEINDDIYITKIRGGKKVSETKKKYEMIKNHTARRSFCTNAYINGMHPFDIMAISGHTSEKVFLKYIKIDTDERAIKISENSFFQPKPKLKVV